MNDDIESYHPSLLNPRRYKRDTQLTQNSFSLSLNRTKRETQSGNEILPRNKEKEDVPKWCNESQSIAINKSPTLFSEDSNNNCTNLNEDTINNDTNINDDTTVIIPLNSDKKGLNTNIDKISENDYSLVITDSSNKDPVDEISLCSDKTIIYSMGQQSISISFGAVNCSTVNVIATKNNLSKVSFNRENNNVSVDCEIVDNSVSAVTVASSESYCDRDNIFPEVDMTHSPQKRSQLTMNLEIKRKKLTADDSAEKSNVLILKTDAIEKLSHVIVQPPNYKTVKRKIVDESKFRSSDKARSIKKKSFARGNSLKQTPITKYFCNGNIPHSSVDITNDTEEGVASNATRAMNKNSGIADVKCDRSRIYKSDKNDKDILPRSARISCPRKDGSKQTIKASSSEAPRVPSPEKYDSFISYSPRKKIDSLQYTLPVKPKLKTSPSTKPIPYYKVVAGTHFAVDAFSYGDIPNVKHYFLTHFHSDHYSGLRKNFNKLLFCSKITADLCVSRLGVNPKYIHIINVDDTLRIDGVEITAVDANHCPGAIMLVFTLPNGKTILHTGDFRATPIMESYPIFWNADIHTIYLDTTYCNPRYDFPTQEHSVEMALQILHQKKVALEKAGKKFSSVLIVCGTYTIGKEKFFMGMARNVGCSVWACPEKDKILQTVEGRSFSTKPPHSCQLHVVPMRDLTHEKLRSYLDSLQGVFSEVVAFKPSGWENGKNSLLETDAVTIHGIPYSEHSSFSEMIRFVKYLKPKQVVPTVDISGGTKSVQSYFPCPLVSKEDVPGQSRLTDYISVTSRQQVPAVT